MKKEERKRKTKPTLDDLFVKVENFDKSKDTNLHKEIVALVNYFNSQYYPGYINISKVRNILQNRRRDLNATRTTAS